MCRSVSVVQFHLRRCVLLGVVRQHHASVLSCPVFVKRWSLPGLSCRCFLDIACDVFIPVFVLPSDKPCYIISMCDLLYSEFFIQLIVGYNLT
jgi:hypothetical protein